MERISQKEKPIEENVNPGELLIVEMEKDGEVIARYAGFYFGNWELNIRLTEFDPATLDKFDRKKPLNPRATIPEKDEGPLKERITHYFIVPREMYES